MNKKFSLDFTISDKQRRIISASATVAVVGALIISVLWFTNPTFRDNVLGNTPEVFQPDISNVEQEQIEKLRSLQVLNPESILFEIINLQDLPVYPDAWVDRHFTIVEQANALLASELADPDNDGLSNKEEYFQGSDPRNPDTLCNGDTSRSECVGRNDGENVANNINPLTGLTNFTNRQFKISKSDKSVLGEIEDSFEQQAKEGVDFPTLYILSRTIDLTDDFNAITVIQAPTDRNSLLDYNEFRVELIEGYVNQDELSNFTKIYAETDVDRLNELRDDYQDQLNKTKQQSVPDQYIESHKAYVLIIDKITSLISHRAEKFEDGTILTDEAAEESKNRAVEVVWAYRKLNETLSAQDQ